MYETHFQFRQAPFSIAPDPEFLYLSAGHREALAHLTYGLNQGGFVLITGEVGTGKTTLLRNLLQHMPADIDVAFILNPRLTVRELLETICDELRIDYSRTDRSSIKTYVDALSAHLLQTHAAGRSTLLIIDEAQNLAPAVLEQIRLLTNLETDKRKLMRIILLGQPELLELLARKELRQLAQRITARYHLRGLDREDTVAYVMHRLTRAGGSPLIFTRPALARLYRISGGIPRLINLIADRALLGTYAAGRQRVTYPMVGRAAREVLGVRPRPGNRLIAGVTALLLLAVAGGYLLLAEPPWAPDYDASGATPEPSSETSTPDDSGANRSRVPGATPQERPKPLPAVPASVAAPDTAEALIEAEPRAAAPPAVDGHAPHTLANDAVTAAPTTDAPRVQTPDPVVSPVLAASARQPEPEAPTDHDRSVGAEPDDRPEAVSATQLTRPDMTTFQTQRLAYQAAFARWGADFGAASLDLIPCDFAPTVGLQCLGASGTWSDLRNLDLPVVLELWDAGSTPFYGAVTAMAGDQVTLNVGGTDLQFDIRNLADNWFGGYVLLWKMPPDYTGSLEQGDQHPSVAWLREQLESLGFEATGGADRRAFDAGLRDAVVRFQEQEGMVADGVVGPITWIRLTRRIDPSLPHLER